MILTLTPRVFAKSESNVTDKRYLYIKITKKQTVTASKNDIKTS